MEGQIPQSHHIAWYHVAVTGGGPLFVHLDKPSSWNSHVALYRETLDGAPDSRRDDDGFRVVRTP